MNKIGGYWEEMDGAGNTARIEKLIQSNDDSDEIEQDKHTLLA